MKNITNMLNLKRTIQILTLLITLTSYSQVIGYDASALLFSTENIKGTSRFTSMSGAFGALGGDISAVNINPAGLTVFNNSEATITLGSKQTDINTNFYNTNTNSSEGFINFSQAGTVLVFENGNDNWNKFALGINYTITNNFDKNYYILGNNSPQIKFNEDPYLNNDNDITNDIFYNTVNTQRFNTISNGSNDKITFSISGQYNSIISYGLSLNTYSVGYKQITKFNETGNDNNLNTIDTQLDQELLINGEGISINLGMLAKFDNFRLGLAYQTPTWYNFTEEFYESSSSIMSNTTSEYLTEYLSTFDFKVKSPSKTTGSLAYIFNKQGLLSIDYTYRNFNKIKLSNELIDENNNLSNNLTNTSEIKIGGEYRLKKVSLRAGYHTKANPVKNIDTNTEGYSLGIGFRFTDATKLDFSYDNTTLQENYNFLESTTNPAEINTTNDRITATLTIGL